MEFKVFRMIETMDMSQALENLLNEGWSIKKKIKEIGSDRFYNAVYLILQRPKQ